MICVTFFSLSGKSWFCVEYSRYPGGYIRNNDMGHSTIQIKSIRLFQRQWNCKLHYNCPCWRWRTLSLGIIPSIWCFQSHSILHVHTAYTHTECTRTHSVHVHTVHTYTQRIQTQSVHVHTAYTSTECSRTPSVHVHTMHTYTQLTNSHSVHVHTAYTYRQRRCTNRYSNTKITVLSGFVTIKGAPILISEQIICCLFSLNYAKMATYFNLFLWNSFKSDQNQNSSI